MHRFVTTERRHSEADGSSSTPEPVPPPPANHGNHPLGDVSPGIETLLTSKEASQVLKIHPKVLERMAKRGEVPALKVGKF